MPLVLFTLATSASRLETGPSPSHDLSIFEQQISLFSVLLGSSARRVRPRLLARLAPRTASGSSLHFALGLETVSSLALFKQAGELLSILATLLACWFRLLPKAARHNNDKAQARREPRQPTAIQAGHNALCLCAVFCSTEHVT